MQRHCQVIFGTVPWEVHGHPSKLTGHCPGPYPESAFSKHSQVRDVELQQESDQNPVQETEV